MSPDGARQRVLLDALRDAVGERRVRAAVFTTYQLDPPFFEDHVLAPLLSVQDGGLDVVRRVLLEEALRELDEVLLLYSPVGLLPTGPLRQAVRAIPVRHEGGVFHPKQVLLLLGDIEPEALVLVTSSANLTRTGWWENVEVADVRSIEAGSASSLRDDLLGLIGWIGDRLLHPSPALGAIGSFVRELRGAGGLPRLWSGTEPLRDFLARHVPRGATLEMAAPFVDEVAAPVDALVRRLEPSRTLVLLPTDREERPACGRGWLDGVEAAGGSCAKLRGVDRSLGRRTRQTRFVHAKFVRAQNEARVWTLAGSPNLTGPGHAGWLVDEGRSNVEAAILDVGADTVGWLAPLDEGGAMVPCASPRDRSEPGEGGGPAIRLRFDWERLVASYLHHGEPSGRVHVGLGGQDPEAPVGRFQFVPARGDEWVDLSAEHSHVLQALSDGTNVLAVWGEAGRPRLVLVEETGLAHRPSRVARELLPGDILRHWTLLSGQDREEAALEALGQAEPLDPQAPVGPLVEVRVTGRTMFDAFAGVFHAFLVLRERLELAADRGRWRVVEVWLLGEKHDSLGTLLDRVDESDSADPVYRLVVLLCARDLWTWARDAWPSLASGHPARAARLEERLARLQPAWDALDLSGGRGDEQDPARFRAWIERNWVGGAP